jgi:hypothetical protein
MQTESQPPQIRYGKMPIPSFDPKAKYDVPAFDPSASFDAATSPSVDLSNQRGEGVYQMKDHGGKIAIVPYSQVQPAAQQGYSFADDANKFRFAKDNAADPNKTASFTPAAGDPRATLEGQRQIERNASIPMQIVGGVAKSAAEMVPGFPKEQTVSLTPTQQAAKYAGTIAQIAPGAADAIVAAPKAIASISPSALKASGAGLLQYVAHDANKIPVQLNNAGDAALQLMDWQKKTQLGPTVNKFLNRITNPKLGQMTYEEARDFYQLLGKLSVDETNKMAPPVRRALTQMVVGLKQDIGDAADQVGHAAEYYNGLKDYAKGAKLQDWYDTAKEWGAKTAIGGALGAIGLKGVESLVNSYRK